MPGDDLQALWHRHDAGQAARTCQRHDARRDAGQPGAHRRIHWLHHERPAVLLRHDARVRTPVHRALGGLSLHGGVRGVQRPRVGGRSGDRFQEAQRRGVRARLERHVPDLHAAPGYGAGRCVTLAMGALRRVPASLQEDPAAPHHGDVRDSGAGPRAADDHPEHPGRRDRSPEHESAASADRRPDHLERVYTADGHDPGNAGELHDPEAGLHDDVAVLPAHPVAALFVLRQAQDGRHLRALRGKPDDPGLPDRIHDQHRAQPADDLHLLHGDVPLQRQTDFAAHRIRHTDPGVDSADDAEGQELRARGVRRHDRREVVPDGSARRGGNRQGHGHRAPGAAEVGEEVREGARRAVPRAVVQHRGRIGWTTVERRHHDCHSVGWRRSGAHARADASVS